MPQDLPVDVDVGLPSPPRHEPVQDTFPETKLPQSAPSFPEHSALSNHATFATPSEPAEHSFGTLVITESGRSKWLGPTAASDWLKDVS